MRRLLPHKARKDHGGSNPSADNNPSNSPLPGHASPSAAANPSNDTDNSSHIPPSLASRPCDNDYNDKDAVAPQPPAVISRIATSPDPDRSLADSQHMYHAQLPGARSASVGDAPPPDLSNLCRSAAAPLRPLYPILPDMPTPHVPWNNDILSSAAVAAPSRPTQYPSGLVIQPIPKKRLQMIQAEPAGQQGSNNNTAPGPLFGRKTKSNPLEETEEDLDEFITHPLIAEMAAGTASAGAAAAAGPLFGTKSARKPLDDDDDEGEDTGFLQSNMESHLDPSRLLFTGMATTPSAAAPFTQLPNLESAESAATGIPMTMTTLDSLPSAPRRNHSDEEEKREISATLERHLSSCGNKARDSARLLLELCSLPQVPFALLEYLNNLISQCEKCQEELIREISTHPESVEELFEVNDYLLHAIRKGIAVRNTHELPKPEAVNLGRTTSHATHSSYSSLPSSDDPTESRQILEEQQSSIHVSVTMDTLPNEPATPPIDVEQLVDKKDIFSLICMLRSQQNYKRLEAALVLMSFARQADLDGSEENIQVRDEIRSSGGMHSLLALFRVRETSHETKVVVALAVAYLLPSFVGSQTPPSLGLKIMDCLRLLSNARTIEPNGEVITRDESFKAGAKGLFLFWINQVEPMLEKNTTPTELIAIDSSIATITSRSGTRHSNIAASAGGGMFDQSRESIEMQELLEITVTLIIYMARDDISTTDGDGLSLNSWRCTLLEQVCAVEAARPIAVREGILGIIVEWIRSRDPEQILTASSALSHLTSIEDKYMAGWIHSQMVNEGVLQGIVNLFDENEYGIPRDVQLAIARILSSLCVAPHTRAAVVEANGVAPLIQFLCEHHDRQEGAFYAGRALLQLAAGAITRANVFGEDDLEVLLFASSDKQDVVVQQIVDSGAINHFVEMASSDAAKLRSVAVEALRVLSEDTSSRRQTRVLLCRVGAAKAFGATLKQCLSRHSQDIHQTKGLEEVGDDCFSDLHEAVCGLANILDPLPGQRIQRNREAPDDVQEGLIHGCKETAESGGLESLLFIASRSRVVNAGGTIDLQLMNLLTETCRSLASMSPLLLSKSIAASSYIRWADSVLFAFLEVLKRLATMEYSGSTTDLVRELQVNVLRGIAALAQSEPLKVRIVDKLLPYLLQDSLFCGGGDVSVYANQTFQSLKFTDDDVAVQVAGNSPQLLADLFCLERSFIIQSMAREEIRQLIGDAWAFALRDTNDAAMTHLVREISDISRSDDSSVCDNLFENFSVDRETAPMRVSIIKQYRDMYAVGSSGESLITVSQSDERNQSEDSLLLRQVYPFTNSDCETQWILKHDMAMRNAELNSYCDREIQLSPHVRTFLEWCFPSQLLQDVALPIYCLRPRASFNFRSLLMPQRRYFSFRREGQLLSRVCAREEALLHGCQSHWILGFTNSSFSGEFSESLVQALYLCPMIRGLTFSKKSDVLDSGESEHEITSEEGGAILAILTGSLPPWITNVTFDGILNDRDMRALVSILETMGKLSRDTGPVAALSDSSMAYGGQGRFCFLAVRRSPKIKTSSWTSFCKLLGGGSTVLSEFPAQSPLSSLKMLDLSGNQLGDDICASILALAHDKDSGCSLEQLDLSGNRILAGNAVLKVLRGYVDHHRYNHRTGRIQNKKSWKSRLHTLYLANNGLHLGKAWLELTNLLKHNALELSSLDLSSNGLTLDDHDHEFMNVLISALMRNTCLTHLNMSENRFSSGAVDHILHELSAAMNDSVLGFFRLDNNAPELSVLHKSLLASVCEKGRKMLLQRFMGDRQAQNVADVTDSGFLSADHDSIDESQLLTIAEDEDTTPVAQIDLQVPNSDNMITVLFSAPLVYTDERNRLCPFAKLEFTLEREHMWQCLKEASRDIDLSFDTATHDRFLAAISKRCSCLHYSGHGHPDFLPFEDKGRPQWFSVQKIKDIIKRDEGASFRFVFVSACHSENAGRTFAEAGVPHVVCCRQDSELKDTAAIAFTRQFYLSLAIGNTVKEAFDLGCKAVRAAPNLRDAEMEMDKFRLLPEHGNHDVTVFNAKPVYEWPRGLVDKTHGKGRRGKKNFHAGGTRASELSVRNMIQEDPAPTVSQYFLGREVDMYNLLRLVLETRLVSVVGEAGIGRSSLVCALCHYINERASTMTDVEHIYFVTTKQSWTSNRAQALVWRLLQKLAEANKIQQLPDENSTIETMSEIAWRVLKNDKVLVVFDRIDLLENTDEISDFPMFLSDLLRETRHVKVLLTNRNALGIPSLGEKSIRLGPLTLANTVKLFAQWYLHTPKTRRMLRQSLILDAAGEDDLLPTDPGLAEDIKRVFHMIGDGVPSRIEKAANNISKEDFLSLSSGSIRRSNNMQRAGSD